MKKKEYLEYLKSESWQQKRRNLARSADAKCFCCGAIPRPGNVLDLHHLTYARVGHELPSDLVAICRSCHDIVHDLVKSSGSIEAATLRVRDLMARKQEWLSRPCTDRLRKPPTHITIVDPHDNVSAKQKPVHPGGLGGLNKRLDGNKIKKRREAKVEQKAADKVTERNAAVLSNRDAMKLRRAQAIREVHGSFFRPLLVAQTRS